MRQPLTPSFEVQSLTCGGAVLSVSLLQKKGADQPIAALLEKNLFPKDTVYFFGILIPRTRSPEYFHLQKKLDQGFSKFW